MEPEFSALAGGFSTTERPILQLKKKVKKLKQVKGGSSKSKDEKITLTLEMVEAALSCW